MGLISWLGQSKFKYVFITLYYLCPWIDQNIGGRSSVVIEGARAKLAIFLIVY